MMSTKKSVVFFGLIALVVAGVATAIDKRPDSPGPGSSSKELVAAARGAFEGYVQMRPLAPEISRLDEIYVWSKRWMTAEWDLSLHSGGGAARGVKAHHDRMVQLEELIRKGHEAGREQNADVSAAKYYRIEAELMLARAGG